MTRLVKVADLDSWLPPHACRLDDRGRREQLCLRKIGVDKRFRA